MKKALTPKTDYCHLYSSASETEKLIIHTYERVTRESIAARAVYKTVDYIHKIYDDLSQDEIDKLFDDLFHTTVDLLDQH